MAGFYKGERESAKKGFNFKKTVICGACFFILLFISVILQTSCLSFFGKVPALCFAMVCAIGFVGGQRMGAIFGLLGGFLTDALGSTGFSFSPALYLLCGYLCGALVGWFLSENLPSFLVYATVTGVIHEIYTAVCCGLLTEDFQPWQIITKLLIPEYFAYLLCVLPAYGAVFGIYTLIKGKDNRRKRGF